MSMTFVISIQIIVLLILVGMSAFFSGSETALFSLSRARLLTYKNDPSRIRRCIVNLMGSYHKTLAALILGNMFVNVAISNLNSLIFANIELNELLLFLLSSFSAVVLLLIFGEVAPKTIAILHAESVSDKIALPVWLFSRITAPAIFICNQSFAFILNLLGRKTPRALDLEEYSAFLDTAYAEGAFSVPEKRLLEGAFKLKKKSASEIMTGRTDIATVSHQMSASEVASVIQESLEEYIPVIDNDIDDAESLLSARKFFMLSEAQRTNWIDSTCLEQASFIPENASLTRVLATMRENAVSTALVTDEYGGIAGILSIDDIYSQLVGDIDDEHDLSDWEIRQIGENIWHFSGSVPLYLLKEATGVEFSGVEANTLNGLFTWKLERIPLLGDKLEISGLEFTVTAVAKHCVKEAKCVLSDRGKESGGSLL